MLTTAEGLSDNRITCFFKDHTGFVWIGTKNGLNRYDGYRIKTFRPGPANSISNEVINDIAEDSRGNIWVATMDGLNVYNPLTDRWECLMPSSDKNANDIPSNLIWDIQIDKKDRVWIASDVQHFCFYQPATKTFTYFDWPSFVGGNPYFANGAYNSVKRFVLVSEEEILLASNKALVKLNPTTKKFTYVAGSYRSDVWDLRHDTATAKTYISIEKGKLLTWDDKDAKLTETLPQSEPYPSAKFVLPSSSEIWMAGETGLIKISSQSGITLVHHIPQLRGSLQPGAVAAVMQNGGGLNWVGTFNGISLYDRQYQSSFFLPLLPASDKESNNNMGSAWFDKVSGCYFICATENSSVFIVERNGGAIREFKVDANGKPFGRCNVIKADRNNNIWLLTDNEVYRFDNKTFSFYRFEMPNKGENVVFRDVALDAEGNYWFGSFHRGVYYYHTLEKKFTKPAGEGFQNILTTTALHADEKKKAIWIGTYSIGFYRYDLVTKKLAAYMETSQHPEYAALNLVNDITQDAFGAIWAATQSGGLFRFTDKGNGAQEIKQFSMRSGLQENSFAAVCASDSLVWALTGNGLIRINITNGAISKPPSSFEFSSYVSDVRFPHKIFYNALDKEVLTSVGGGLLFTRINTEAISTNIPVVITSISVNEKPLPNNDLQLKQSLNLSSAENNLSFSFAKLYYGLYEGYDTEYKLEGGDHHWIKAGNDQQASYQNLAPGNYQFFVRVKDAKGNVIGNVSSRAFHIKPPFWERWWFQLLIVSLLLIIAYGFYKRRVGKIKKEAAIRQQLTELESKALRAQMNPHFIFNSLNAIQELIVTQNVEASYDYLSKFSKLLRQVLNHSDKPAIPLADEMIMLQLYLELESLRFRKAFSYNIHIDPSIDTETVLVPPLLLQPFIENAVWHGLMLKEGEKKINLFIRQQQSQILCIIEDNGIGRTKSAEIKAQKIGAQHFESKGLKLSQHRIQLLRLNGSKASVKIEDLYENNLAAGTRVSIELPVIHA